MKKYKAPKVKVIEYSVEQGFALSVHIGDHREDPYPTDPINPGTEEYEDGGDLFGNRNN